MHGSLKAMQRSACSRKLIQPNSYN